MLRTEASLTKQKGGRAHNDEGAGEDEQRTFAAGR